MRVWLANKWENLRTSLWFLPSMLVTLCVSLATITLRWDGQLAAQESVAIPYLFSGTADAARTMLSTIASSLLTVLSIAFSLTMVALQQASSQFSPRVLRSITASRVNQTVVGVYAGTFIYALLILRTIRGEHAGAPFVPALSVTSAVLLALVCIAMLVYFIHHVSLSLQVSEIIKDLHDTLIHQIEQQYAGSQSSSDDGELEARDSRARTRVCAHTGGFVRRIDPSLAELRVEGATIWLTASVGGYVPRGGTLAHVAPADKRLIERVRTAYVLGSERSAAQDPLFAVRQLVDIGLRALSPGVNDPTTAEYVLRQLGDALTVLVAKEIPARRADDKAGCVRVIVDSPTWQDYIEEAFSQLRRHSRADFAVTRCLLDVLGAVGESTTTEGRASAVRMQVAEVRLALSAQSFSDADREQLRMRCDSVMKMLAPSAVHARAASSAEA